MSERTYIIHINGYPGMGKYTVAKALCAMNEHFKLMDNHLTTNPIFKTFRVDGSTRVPDAAWDAIDQIRLIVWNFMKDYAHKDFSFVITNNYYESDKTDLEILQKMQEVADHRGSEFVPILFTCAENENKKRVTEPSRFENLKMTDVDRLIELHSTETPIRYDHKNFLELDVTHMAPEETAKAILNHLNTI